MTSALRSRAWRTSAALASIALLACTRAKPSTDAWYEIASPLDRQVFQRDAEGRARIAVFGTVPDEAPELYVGVSLSEHAAKGALSISPVTTRDLPGPRKRFDARVVAPEGGWHSLQLCARHGEQFEVLKRVARFGVGELFLIAGQSNSTNYGEERLPSFDDFVSAYDGVTWSLAQDPMPGVQDDSQGGSPWPLFGHLVRESVGVPVGIASAGYQGTSLAEWQPGTQRPHTAGPIELYAALRERIGTMGDVRAILWHQGETDAERGTSQDQYVAWFDRLSTTLAHDTGSRAPWLVAHTTYLPRNAIPRRIAIRAAQAEIWECGLALPGPETDDLLGALRHSADFKHFSRAGLEVHARRWFDAVREQVLARTHDTAK